MGIPYLAADGCRGKTATVYVLMDPRDSTAFYVGVTTRPLSSRFGSHLNDALVLYMRGARYDAIRSICADGLRPEMHALEVVPFDQWVDAEQFWIAYLRGLGAVLTNVSTGGPGTTGVRQTLVIQKKRQDAAAGRDMSHLHTPEMRAKAGASISKTLMGRTPTEETRKRLSDAKRGERHNMWGKPKSPETRAKMAASNKGKPKPTGANASHTRPVIIDGIQYWGATGAAAALGVHRSTIAWWVRQGRGSYPDGGPAPKIYTPARKGRPTGEEHHQSRPIMIDGVRYWGIGAAATALGRSRVTVSRWLKNGKAVPA
jgi:NUMOD3 motif